MKQNLLKTCVPLSAALLLSGCIDNKYDLSDIDKTTQINVNDLVIPVNVDAVKLDDIITIDDDSKIKIVNLNGTEVYAVSETGDFNSDDINIKGFRAEKPEIGDAHLTFELRGPETKAITEKFYYDFKTSDPQEVHFKASDVDESIKEISALEFLPMKITMHMTTTGLDDNAEIMLPTLQFNFLKGLVVENLPSNYSYDPNSGVLIVRNLNCPNRKGEVTITAVGLNFEQAGDDASLIDHNFVFKSDIEITDAKMELTMTYDTQAPALDNLVDFDIHTTVEDLEATYFSGIVQYKLEGDALNIDPVSLSDIPDFLSNEETDLRLANPQIYLGLNNPMAVYNLKVETGLELASVRGEEKTPFNLNAGELVKIGTNYGVNGPYNFVLSPSMPQQPLPAYAEHLTHVGFSSLSNVLAGNGLPESIEINLVNPELPEQPVSRFELNNSISGVKGTYEFLAPLALKTGENGSVIVYSKVDDGWSDDDLDKLTINTLSIDADVDSNLPLNANLTVYPIDKQGNVISNVKVTTATIAANTSGQKLSLALTGEIKELDGVKYEAVVRPGSEEALSPNQTLTLTNIRVKVSGYYLTDFD